MADTKTTALTELASGAIDDLDVAPVVDVSDTTQGASGTLKKFKWSSIKATLKTYLDTLYLAATGGTISSGTKTASAPALTVTQTFNNAGVTFVGNSNEFTDTASATASVLERWTVGGAEKVAFRKDGALVWSAAGSAVISNYGTHRLVFYCGGSARMELSGSELSLMSGGALGWSSNASNPGYTVDLFLYRDGAAGTLAQRNGTNAQMHRWYGTYTDASNYRRVAVAMTTAGVATITPEGAGTGASGNVLHISGLPTSNPGAGILWNDAGTVKVGT